jgi:hypothetical protein
LLLNGIVFTSRVTELLYFNQHQDGGQRPATLAVVMDAITNQLFLLRLPFLVRVAA